MRRLLAIAAAVFVSLPAISQSVTFNTIPLSKGGQVIGDFNADGREDILSYYSPGHFQLQISNGDGTYYSGSPVAVPNGGYAAGFAVGDFNNDGKLDLAVLSSAQNSKLFYVYLGNGDGTLRAPVAHALSFAPYSAIVAADVNHDGKMDLVLINQGSSVTTFVTELGNGAGGFSAGPISASAYSGLYNLYTGDFNGDGKADLFSGTCGPGGCNLIVFYGDGTGRFGSPTTASANQSNWTIADVDGDGKSDILSSTMGYINSSDQPYLSVWYGTANRTLQAGQIPTSQCTFGQPAVGDFNGDHIPDIIFPEHSCSGGASAEIAFLAGKGARTFGSEQTLFNSTSTQQPGGATATMRGNRDTKPDLLFNQSTSTSGGSTQGYYILMNQTSGKFAACTAPNHPTGFHVCSPASGSTVYSPVKFSIGASGQVPMRKVEVWVDGVKKYQSLYGFSHYAFLDASIPLSSGTHAIAVFAAGWDNSLQLKKYSITVH